VRERGISSAPLFNRRRNYGDMDISVMTRIEYRRDRSCRLKNLSIYARIKAEIVAVALAKNSKAISLTRGGQMGGQSETPEDPTGLRGAWASLVIPISSTSMRRTIRFPSGCCGLRGINRTEACFVESCVCVS
jgi:hypothetical protein